MDVEVKLDGVAGLVLEKLVQMGYFESAPEAIRAGVIALGMDYGMLDDPKELEDEIAARKAERINREINEGKRTTSSLEDIRKDAKARGK